MIGHVPPTMKRTTVCALAFALGSLTLVAPARAEETATLAAAERAYADVDFDKTRELARGALQQGGHDPRETKRLYALIGISAAALEDEVEARDAFRRVLGIDPTTRLEQSLSPKMRAPYLEARGALAAAGEEHPLQAAFEREGESFAVELRDASNIARTVELALTTPGTSGGRTLRFEPRARTVVGEASRLPERFNYVLSVSDEHNNQLFVTRGQVAPAAPVPTASEVLASAARAPAAGAAPDRTPYFVTAGVLAAFGVGAVAGGVVAQLRREDAAKEWNSSDCEVPGQTRGEQCRDVDSARKSAENWAIGLYAAGGALLLGSAITILVAPGAPERERARLELPCTLGLGHAGVAGACRAHF
jgi:hypothetical protein